MGPLGQLGRREDLGGSESPGLGLLQASPQRGRSHFSDLLEVKSRVSPGRRHRARAGPVGGTVTPLPVWSGLGYPSNVTRQNLSRS